MCVYICYFFTVFVAKNDEINAVNIRIQKIIFERAYVFIEHGFLKCIFAYNNAYKICTVCLWAMAYYRVMTMICGRQKSRNGLATIT